MSKVEIFMIMPFDIEFDDLFERIKYLFEDGNENLKVFRSSNLLNQHNILKDIVVSIHASDLIIADLTGLNANVFYELGLAHALNKKVVLLTQDIEEVPFDLRSYRIFEYSTYFSKFTQFEIKLKRFVNEFIEGNIAFGSPITDWLPNHISQTSLAPVSDIEETPKVLEDNGEGLQIFKNEDKGILDFMQDVEEGTNQLNTFVLEMSDNINELVATMEVGTKQLQQSGNNPDASYRRKIARKTSKAMNEFGLFVEQNNKVYEVIWNKIEQGLTNLILSPYIDWNDEDVREVIVVLEEFRANMIPAKEAVEQFSETMYSLIGFESSINRASSLVARETKLFAGHLDKTISTLDKNILVAMERANIVSSQ